MRNLPQVFVLVLDRGRPRRWAATLLAVAVAAGAARAQDAAALVASAEKAEAEGLKGKAARDYLAAFRLDPSATGFGLRAARAFLAVDERLEAARVLQVLLRRGVDEAKPLFGLVEADATAEHDRLATAAREKAAAGDAAGALESLRGARELVAASQSDDLLAAGLFAKAGRIEDALGAVRDALGRGAIDAFDLGAELGSVAGAAAAGAVLRRDEFRAYLLDLVGKKGYEQVLEGIAGREVTNSIGMRLMRIRPGRFLMGSPEGEPGREADEVQHEVALSKPYYLGVTEVTQAQWRAVTQASPSHFRGDDLPVEQVSWEDAVRFCARLSEMEGAHYRLPTEAEWEYACRAGTSALRYGDLNAVAWHGGNCGDSTHAVGGKGPNAFGLYDMLGNVWEWCADWYGPYPPTEGAATDPAGPATGDYRVMRGGSWFHDAKYSRAAFRYRVAPSVRSHYFLGLRIARDG